MVLHKTAHVIFVRGKKSYGAIDDRNVRD